MNLVNNTIVATHMRLSKLCKFIGSTSFWLHNCWRFCSRCWLLRNDRPPGLAAANSK